MLVKGATGLSLLPRGKNGLAHSYLIQAILTPLPNMANDLIIIRFYFARYCRNTQEL